MGAGWFDVRDKMEVQQNLKAAKATQNSWYDKVSRQRSFSLGLKILSCCQQLRAISWSSGRDLMLFRTLVQWPMRLSCQRGGSSTTSTFWRSGFLRRLYCSLGVSGKRSSSSLQPKVQEVHVNMSHLSASQQEELHGTFPKGLFAETPGPTRQAHHPNHDQWDRYSYNVSDRGISHTYIFFYVSLGYHSFSRTKCILNFYLLFRNKHSNPEFRFDYIPNKYLNILA